MDGELLASLLAGALGFFILVMIGMMPSASSVDIFKGITVNTGVSVGEGFGGGIEMIVTKDPKTGEPAIGTTVAAGLSAKLNLPVPLIEYYGNVTRTELSPFRYNIFDLFGIPRPH